MMKHIHEVELKLIRHRTKKDEELLQKKCKELDAVLKRQEELQNKLIALGFVPDEDGNC